MRLIIEVDNQEELKQAQDLIASYPLKSLKIKEDQKRNRKDFVQWCRDNKALIKEIPSREERHER
jgi:hypothetical protein